MLGKKCKGTSPTSKSVREGMSQYGDQNISDAVGNSSSSIVDDSENRVEEYNDKLFVEKRDMILQDINSTMDSILNNLNGLNISLESSIALGSQFESVCDLWKTFYDSSSSKK